MINVDGDDDGDSDGDDKISCHNDYNSHKDDADNGQASQNVPHDNNDEL